MDFHKVQATLNMKKVICFILFVSYCNLIFGQIFEANFSTVTTKDGLSHPYITSKYEDSKGFMWLSTFDAVNRWDGVFMKVYNHEKQFLNGPLLQQSYGFVEDESSNIYTGSKNGLYEYIRTKDVFRLYDVDPKNKDKHIIPFAYKEDKIWCFNRKYQIIAFNIHTKKSTFYTDLNFEPIKSFHIYQSEFVYLKLRIPFFDTNGVLWLANDHKIAAYNLKNAQVNYFSFPLKTDKISSCVYDKQKNRLLLSCEKGIYEFSIKTNKFSFLFPINNIKKTFTYPFFQYQNYWITNFNHNFTFLNLENKTKAIFDNYTQKTINEFWIDPYLYVDKKDNLWFTKSDGQFICNFKKRILNRVTSTTENYYLKYGVLSFAQKNDDELFVSCPNAIHIYNTKKKKFSATFYINKEETNHSYRISDDKIAQKVWLFSTNPINKHIKYYDLKSNKTEQINYTNDVGVIQDIHSLSKDFILLTASNGVFKVDLTQKRITLLPEIKQKEAFKINVLNKNFVAISFSENEMKLYQYQKNQLKFIKNILPNVVSFYIIKDKNQPFYWVGTTQGVFKLDQNFNKVKKIQGFAGNYIYGIGQDKSGNIWASHQMGLSRILKENESVVNFDEVDGIQDKDFNNRCFYTATDGTFYIGGNKGFNWIDKNLNFQFNYKPELYVNEIFINNSSISKGKNANLISKINTNYDANNLDFHVVVKDLEIGKKLSIIYRFKGIDKNWKTLPNNSHIIFNSLNSGDYNLELGYYNPYLGKNILQKEIEISISTPFYKRILFWIFVSIVFTTLLLWYFAKRKIAKQRIYFQQQVALEQQRNKISADLHDDIGSTLSSLQINSAVANQLINKNPTEAKIILEKIENQSQSLADKIGDIVWSMKPEKEQFMTISARIKNFANDILGATNIQYKISIDKEIDQLVKDITIKKNSVLIIKEAINNAAKYSKASNLEVKIKWIENAIHIKISDNGIGFNTSEIKGNGMGNMKKRTDELKGTILIISEKNIGTTINVTIPCPII